MIGGDGEKAAVENAHAQSAGHLFHVAGGQGTVDIIIGQDHNGAGCAFEKEMIVKAPHFKGVFFLFLQFAKEFDGQPFHFLASFADH